MKIKPDIYREAGETCEWIAYIKQRQDRKSVEVNLGKFSDWLLAYNYANEKFGANQVVLVEPK
jgi:hypothetical protein